MPGKDNKAYKGWRGTIKAALDHHPEKFSKEACKGKDTGKLCPYAIFTKKKKEGDEPHYKEQPHTTSGTPKKKEKFKNESFSEYVKLRDGQIIEEAKKKKKMGGYLNASFDMP